jgi:hypothetical protein
VELAALDPDDPLPFEIALDCADRLVAAWNELELEPLLLALDVLATLELSPDPPVETLGVLPEELVLLEVDWTCCGTSLPEDPPDEPCLP